MSKSSKVDASFINFLADKVKNVDSPMNIRDLCKEFMKKNKKSLSENVMRTRVNQLRYKMDEIENIDTETKVKMIFALSAPIGNGFLIELEKQAVVELDKERRIIKYESIWNSLKLNGEHNFGESLYSMETQNKMLELLAEKSQNATSPIIVKGFVRDFKLVTGDSMSKNYLKTLFQRMKKHIYLAPEFDKKTKIKMLFVASVEIYETILEELREDAVVEVDDKCRIIKYKANDGSLELIGDHSQSAKTKMRIAKDENDQEAKELVNDNDRFTRSRRLSKRLHPMDDSVYNSDEDASKSPKEAKTKKDSMTSVSAEINRNEVEERKRSRNTNLSESDEESDYDGEEVEEVSKLKKRRSNRKRCVSEASKESEEDENKEKKSLGEEDEDVSEPKMSSENVKRSKIDEEKQAEESATFTLQTPLQNNRRRPIIGSSSAISTASENTGNTTDMNVQNSMESIEFTMDNSVTVPDNLSCESERNQVDSQSSDSNEELIKQEPIGSTPCKEQKVNQKEGEYKPDRSFLSSKKPSIETEENRIDDKEESNVPRGSNEVISNQIDGKDFLMMLRGLVCTLVSSNLGELQSKIDDAIENVGDQTISTDDIVQTLNTGLRILNINAKLEPPSEEFTSLRDFYLILLSTLSTLSFPSLYSFQLKMKETITELAVQDKFVAIKSIRTVLDTVLMLVIS